MSITRINDFLAKSDKAKELLDFLKSILPAIRSYTGGLACQLLQSHDDPARFVVIEQWESIAAHKESARNIRPENIAKAMVLG